MIIVVLTVIANTALSQAGAIAIKKVTAADVRTIMDTSSQPLIINFWASWCGPCIREIPYMEELVNAAPQPVRLILVSLDFPASYPAKLQQFVKKAGYKSEVLYLVDLEASEYSPVIDARWQGEIPASVFVNNAKKYYSFINMQLTRPRLALELKEFLK